MSSIATIIYGFGGIRIGVSRTSSLTIHDDPVYDRFILYEEPHIQIECCDGTLYDFNISNEHLIFESDSIWSIYGSGSNIFITLTSPEESLPYTVGEFDQDFRTGTIHTRMPGFENLGYLPCCFEYPMAAIILMCVAPRFNGLMVHACGVDHQGQGILFVGTSRAGKTTTAELWSEECTILNDDRIYLYKDDHEFKIVGLPWHGEYPKVSANPVPLKHIFFLEKGAENEIFTMNAPMAAMRLFQQSSIAIWDNASVSASLGLIDQILNNVPFSILKFRPDPSAVDFVKCRI